MNVTDPIVVVIQARMSSTRLPGKVLRRCCGAPILALQIDKLKQSSAGSKIVVATSDEPSDDPIADWCGAEGIEFARGPLARVADRIGAVVASSGAQYFVRFCADRPYYDWRILERATEIMFDQNVDLVTNAFPPSFPKGQMTEVIRSAAFLETLPEISTESDQEHVTSFFYSHPERFRIANLSSGDPRWHEENLALDTELDWEVFEAVMGRLERPHTEYTWREYVQFVRAERKARVV